MIAGQKLPQKNLFQNHFRELLKAILSLSAVANSCKDTWVKKSISEPKTPIEEFFQNILSNFSLFTVATSCKNQHNFTRHFVLKFVSFTLGLLLPKNLSARFATRKKSWVNFKFCKSMQHKIIKSPRNYFSWNLKSSFWTHFGLILAQKLQKEFFPKKTQLSQYQVYCKFMEKI